MYIKARFLDENGFPKGREYTYGIDDLITVGEVVCTPEGKELVVTAIDLPDEVGAEWGDKLKYLTTASPDSDPLQVEQIPLGEIPFRDLSLKELTVSADDVITIEQLPLIAERFRELSFDIDERIAVVIALECTPETKAKIKKERAALNSVFNDLENRRIAVKKQIMAPYDAVFGGPYKEYVTDKFKAAFATLDERTGAIDNELKNELLSDVKDYFVEYACAQGVEWLTFAQSNINVGLSDNKTALRRSAKSFIDRVVADLAMIDTQEEKAEMHVEYRKTLNAAVAIKTVKDRAAAIQLEKVRQENLASANAAEAERRRSMAAAAPVVPVITPPVIVPTAPPIVDIVPEHRYTAVFKATATNANMRALALYMKNNGIEYVQVPLKNIVEVTPND